jgi:hypothetical protein
MATIDRETILPATEKSSHESQICRIKTSRDKSSVIKKDEDLNSLDLIGLIGNAQLFVLSYPYLTITKCA